ncbi:hypothetical protein LCGC14_0810380 [marine sediment metagenome]|uniref:Uncharacterized protein n=1 Tax=marine sediment metagenome TaxID=412755 RepID=A0A0F9PRF8_9ZZZZ
MLFQKQLCPTLVGLWYDCGLGCQHWRELGSCRAGKTEHGRHPLTQDHEWGDEQSPKRERAIAGRSLESD